MPTNIFSHNELPCGMTRTAQGHLCGYVGVPEGHPYHGLAYDDSIPVSEEELQKPFNADRHGVLNIFCFAMSEAVEDKTSLPLVLVLEVHGGLTWSDSNPGYGTDSRATWWFGFDCAHAGDSPEVQTPEYVEKEIRQLADQLWKAAQ